MAPKMKPRTKNPKKIQAKITDPPPQGKKIIEYFNFSILNNPQAKYVVLQLNISIKKDYTPSKQQKPHVNFP